MRPKKYAKKITLAPLKFEEVVKDLTETKPPDNEECKDSPESKSKPC